MRVVLQEHEPAATDADVTVHQALVAAASEGDGELVIRAGARIARLFFHAGQVAWIHISGEGSSVAQILSGSSEIDDEAARLVLEECHATGGRLSDTLVSWGLLDHQQLRSCWRDWLRKQVATLLTFERPSALFLPQALSYSDDLSFSVEELLEGSLPAAVQARARLSAVPASARAPAARAPAEQGHGWSAAFLQEGEPSAESTHLLQRCMALEGTRGVALLDRVTGLCLGRIGSGLCPDVAWSFIRSLNVLAQRELVVQGAITTDLCHHLVQPLATGASRLAYVVADRRQVRLATALIQLKQLLERTCQGAAQ